MHDASGKSYDLHSSVDKNESNFLKEIIQKNNFRNTIEIGCAFGISSLNICAALSGVKNPHHTIIDPFQSTRWINIGRLNLEKSGIDFFEIIEGLSEIVFPQLLASGKKYDFAFIDGWHTFDHTLLDFFYLNRMLNRGRGNND